MEDSGLVRRGMFVGGLGAAQFAMNSAVDMLRTLRKVPEVPEALHLASADPANPYGSILRWPSNDDDATKPMLSRTVGTSVVLVNGTLAAYLRRNSDVVTVFLPEAEPDQSTTARALAKKLAEIAVARQKYKTGLLVGEINGVRAQDHFLARFLQEAGFVATALGYQMRRVGGPLTSRNVPSEEEVEEEPEDESSETSGIPNMQNRRPA